MIDSEPGLKVVGQAVAIDQLPVVAAREQPDVTLLDLDHGSALDVVPELLSMTGTDARVIVLTSVSDPTVRSSAFRQGALGLVAKQQPPAVLIKAIKKVHAGEVWLERSLTARLIADLMRPSRAGAGASCVSPRSALSARDRQVIVLTAQGLRNKEIAGQLYISEGTVRNYLTSIYRRLGLSGRFQLVMYACRQGLVKLPSGDAVRIDECQVLVRRASKKRIV